MDTSNSSLSGSSCTQSDTSRSSVPELANGNPIQVHSSSASEDQLSDHNEDEAQPSHVSCNWTLSSFSRWLTCSCAYSMPSTPAHIVTVLVKLDY